jgi:GH15 family glucan-1,4-alpha-glucosidase
MYKRSLLTVHALKSKRTGAVAAGARDGWAYVWPRDAAAAALALEASGHSDDARAVVKFLTGLDLAAAARFGEDGEPIPGRAAQGDALGWVDAAAKATGLPTPKGPYPWRDRADYQESSPGDYLGNAIAAGDHGVLREFGATDGLVRAAGDPESGLDSAAGWAVRPFRLRAVYPAAERTLLRLAENATPDGITPGEGWEGGEDPWTAPTAWSAWALAGLAAQAPGPRASADRRGALELLHDLRRASTPAGALPERVGAHTGIPTSTTPLLWSSAFAVLALRELWP